MNGIHSYHRIFALLFGIAALLLSAWAGADPPARVMRLGYASGSVNLMESGDSEWSQASINLPVIGGDRLWAGAASRAELQLGTSAIRIDGNTSAAILDFDDRQVRIQLDQGRLNVRVRSMNADEVIEIDTPNLAFTIRSPGEYSIEADPSRDSTTVTTLSGEAEAYSEGTGYLIGARTSYRFFGAGLRDYEFLNIAPADEFDRWASDRERRWAGSTASNYVSRDMIGYEDLDAYGNWNYTENYGYVWYPNRVSLNWTPYYDGRWVWYDPWGWTWVDNAPWGFTVSHYGRWAQHGRRWCWVPGPIVPRPVYAPALVAFVGGRDFQFGFQTGNIGGVAWFPLGPREIYRPSYQVSREYFSAINSGNSIVNITNVYNNVNVRNVTYVNRQVPGAVVAVPETAFAKSQHVSRVAVRVSKEIAANAPVSSIPPALPTQARKAGGARHERWSRDAAGAGAQNYPAPIASEKIQSLPAQEAFSAPAAPAIQRRQAEQRDRSGWAGQPAVSAPPQNPSPVRSGGEERHGKFQSPADSQATVPSQGSAPNALRRQTQQFDPSPLSRDRVQTVTPFRQAAPIESRDQVTRREKLEPPPARPRRASPASLPETRRDRRVHEEKQDAAKEGRKFNDAHQPR